MHKKLKLLKKLLKKLGRVLIAYSGGLDSSFLIKIAKDTLGYNNVTAVTVLNETFPKDKLIDASIFAKKINIKHMLIKMDMLKNTNFKKNTIQRCFYCKDIMFEELSFSAKKNNMRLCDGTNFSDIAAFRPGIKAAKKWGVTSPLLEVKLTRKEIITLSKKLNLSTWKLPPQTCYATRIPFGTKLDKKLITKIEKGENFIKKSGFEVVRIRDNENSAKIEVNKNKINDVIKLLKENKLTPFLKKLGWENISVDKKGYH